MFVAPVTPFTMYPFNCPPEILGKDVFAAPPIPGYPPLQLASPGTDGVDAGSATQFDVPPVGGGNVLREQPPAAVETYTVPPYPLEVGCPFSSWSMTTWL
jgi:hypothetical protein